MFQGAHEPELVSSSHSVLKKKLRPDGGRTLQLPLSTYISFASKHCNMESVSAGARGVVLLTTKQLRRHNKPLHASILWPMLHRKSTDKLLLTQYLLLQ